MINAASWSRDVDSFEEYLISIQRQEETTRVW